MSKNFKRAAAVIIALTLAIGAVWLSRQSSVKASGSDGYDTAGQLEQAAEKDAETVQIEVKPVLP